MSNDRATALRYALTRDRRLALWRDGAGVEIAGLAEWEGGNVRLDDEAERAQLEELARTDTEHELPGWLVRLFAAHGAPCRHATLELLYAGTGLAATAVITAPPDATQPLQFDPAEQVDFESLAAFVEGSLPAERAREIEVLVPRSPALGRRIEELRALAGRVATRRQTPRAARPAPPPVPPVAASSETAGLRGLWIALGAAVGLSVVVALVGFALGLFGAKPSSQAAPPPTSPVASAPATTAPAPAAAPLVVLFDGQRRVAVTAERKVDGLPGISIPLERRIVRALVDGEVPTPEGMEPLQTPSISGPSVPLAEGEAVPTLTAPVATRVIDELPVFRFDAGDGVRSLRVHVTDLAGREVATSGELPANRGEWLPDQRLPSGRTLSWHLELRRRGNERLTWPEIAMERPRFELARSEQLAYVERELQAARGSNLAAALLYAELGALDRAREAVEELEAENPGNPAIAALRATLAVRR